MNERLCHIIRQSSRPLSPIPTGVEGKLQHLEEIRAVLFDIYGTLFVSRSGEIGGAGASADLGGEDQNLNLDQLSVTIGKAFYKLFADAIYHQLGTNKLLTFAEQPSDQDFRSLGKELMSEFKKTIHEIHAAKRKEGVPWPEIDVRGIWGNIIGKAFNGDEVQHKIDHWAVEYEVKTNPVWPMPHTIDCIGRLGSAKLALGIISNAQFYTPLLFPALLERDLEELEISPKMQYYSYQSGRSKPDSYMFESAEKALGVMGITAGQTLYVGNDMLNDMMPAAQVGFRTALLAADQRSLRLRAGDPRVAQVDPDIVAMDLEEVVACVLPQ